MKISIGILPTAAFNLVFNQQIVNYLATNLKLMVDAINQNNEALAAAGRIVLAPMAMTLMGEVPCDHRKLLKASYPELFKAIGTQFNAGDELPTEFRVPLMYNPADNVQYRIKTGV